MNPLITLGLLAGVPLFLVLFRRVGAVYIFASVAAGGLLVQYLKSDVAFALDAFVTKGDLNLIAGLGLTLLPLVLSLLFLGKTLRGAKVFVEIFPIIASLIMLIVLVIPQLPPALKDQIVNTQYGKIIDASRESIIGGAIILNLLIMWLFSRGVKEDDKRKHHRSR